MNLNLIYDSSVNTAPSGFTSALNDLVSFFQSTFQDPVTVNIAIGYGEIGGQALDAGALGESGAFYNIFSYAQLRSAFASDVKSADDASAVASLPIDAPVDGNFWVTRGEAKALALINPASTRLDGYVGFNASTNIFDYDTGNGVSKGQYDFYAVAAHEISEIMGRQLMDGGGSGTSYEPMDLFHYAGPENRIFVGYQAGYFSPDDGSTDLGDFNTIQGGDLGDWASSVGRDAFRAFSGSGVVNAITANDIRVMDVLGWDVTGSSNLNSANIIGDSGNNTLIGTDGNDYMQGGPGDDYLDGRLGLDTASYADASGGVTVDLNINGPQNVGGGAGTDELVSIEYLSGSAFDDTLIGNGINNYLAGSDGNDFLQGGVGDDYLKGGAGFDIASYADASGGVHVDLNIAGPQNVGGGAGADELVSIEYLSGSVFDDTLIGDSSNNYLAGSDGNDFLQGGAGDDYLKGGAGFDAASYADASGGVHVDLNINGPQNVGGGAGTDELVSIEYLSGSVFDDTLIGDSSNNYLAGSDGNDILQGGAGDDYLKGGAGNDSLTGGAGADALTGGTGADRFIFTAVTDFASGPSFDTIIDFHTAESDKIAVSAINGVAAIAGSAFAFIGAAAFSNVAGQLHYVVNGSGGVNVEGDTNGDGIADFTLVVNGVASLAAGDFVL